MLKILGVPDSETNANPVGFVRRFALGAFLAERGAVVQAASNMRSCYPDPVWYSRESRQMFLRPEWWHLVKTLFEFVFSGRSQQFYGPV